MSESKQWYTFYTLKTLPVFLLAFELTIESMHTLFDHDHPILYGTVSTINQLPTFARIVMGFITLIIGVAGIWIVQGWRINLHRQRYANPR